MNGWWIGKINVQYDHAHILIQLNPRTSVAEAVKILKGGTSRVLRKEFPELEEFLWGDSFWSDGYFAETVGQVEEEVIRKYIDEQRK
jgi:putative transposase